jgi:peptide/nickel transport system permease protein
MKTCIKKYYIELGLDKPLHIQYLRWLGGVVQGDLGRSIISKQHVSVMIRERISAKFELTAAGFVFAALIALPIGISAAVKRGSFFDLICTQSAVLGTAIPTFFLGIVLILVFAVRYQFFPPSGYESLWRGPGEGLAICPCRP